MCVCECVLYIKDTALWTDAPGMWAICLWPFSETSGTTQFWSYIYCFHWWQNAVAWHTQIISYPTYFEQLKLQGDCLVVRNSVLICAQELFLKGRIPICWLYSKMIRTSNVILWQSWTYSYQADYMPTDPCAGGLANSRILPRVRYHTALCFISTYLASKTQISHPGFLYLS